MRWMHLTFLLNLYLNTALWLCSLSSPLITQEKNPNSAPKWENKRSLSLEQQGKETFRQVVLVEFHSLAPGLWKAGLILANQLMRKIFAIIVLCIMEGVPQGSTLGPLPFLLGFFAPQLHFLEKPLHIAIYSQPFYRTGYDIKPSSTGSAWSLEEITVTYLKE